MYVLCVYGMVLLLLCYTCHLLCTLCCIKLWDVLCVQGVVGAADAEVVAVRSEFRGHDDYGGRGAGAHGAAVQQRHNNRQQPLGRRVGQREQLGTPLRALPHQGPGR